MGTVTVEIWAWPPIPKLKLEEAKERTSFQEEIYSGISALDLFNRMALNRKNFGEFIFDKGSQSFNFHVSVIINEKLAKASELCKTYLKNGDRIVIIPLAGGG
jgi:DNA replication protein DnaC